MDISDDESGKEEEEEELSLSKEKELVIESCITYNICRVYRRKKAKSKYEIGTLWAGNNVDYSRNESGGGWFKVLTPLPGWILYSELTPPALTEQELEKLEKQKQAKMQAIDLTADTTTSKDVSPAAKKPTETEEESEKKKLNGNKNGKEITKKDEVAVNGPTNGKTKADKKKESMNGAGKAKEDEEASPDVEIIELE